MSFSDKAVLVSSDTWEIYGLQVEGNFPDWRRAIPGDSKYSVQLPREAMIDAIRRVRPFTNERFFPIVMEFSKKEVLIRNVTGGEHSSNETVGIENGPELKTGCNPNYLEQALSAMGGEKVELLLTDGLTPLYLRGENFIGIIAQCSGIN